MWERMDINELKYLWLQLKFFKQVYVQISVLVYVNTSTFAQFENSSVISKLNLRLK